MEWKEISTPEDKDVTEILLGVNATLVSVLLAALGWCLKEVYGLKSDVAVLRSEMDHYGRDLRALMGERG